MPFFQRQGNAIEHGNLEDDVLPFLPTSDDAVVAGGVSRIRRRIQQDPLSDEQEIFAI